jgi:Mn-dependent DtxR family transcriptional regulator
MRASVAFHDVADQSLIQSLQEVLRKNGEPMMIKALAEGMGVSQNTAGKYVDICAMAGMVTVKPFATAKLVSLTSTGKGGAGGR